MSRHQPTLLSLRRRKRRQVLNHQKLEQVAAIKRVLRLLDWPPAHQLWDDPWFELAEWVREQDPQLVDIAAQTLDFDLNKLGLH